MSFLSGPGGTSSFADFRRNAVAVLVAGIFYGIYTVLFTVGVYTVQNRLRRTRRDLNASSQTPMLLLFATIIVFFLSTLHMVLIAVYHFKDGPIGDLVALDQQLGYLFTANTAITSIIMIYRCYCIWGYMKKVIVAPIILLTSAIVLGIVFPASQTLAKTVLVLCDSTLVTCLTVGRIWYLARRILVAESNYNNVSGGKQSYKMYSMIIIAVIESAALYTTFLIFGVLSTCVPAIIANRRLVSYALMQITSIFPTLIIVLIALGMDMATVVETQSATQSSGSVVTLVGRSDDGEDVGSEKGATRV